LKEIETWNVACVYLVILLCNVYPALCDRFLKLFDTN